jgi:predicted nuclease of restriction endonuclease-like (RecB) superfamily
MNRVRTQPRKTKAIASARAKPLDRVTRRLLSEIRELIDRTRSEIAQTVNAGLVLTYWLIGERIRKEILKEERADYGKQIVATLSQQLTAEYGKGFTEANLFNMIRFAETFPDKQIVYALSRELSWTHFRRIIYIDDPLKRDFYAEMCRVERWSTRTLNAKIDGMLFERTALVKKPERVIQRELAKLRDEDRMTPDLVFRDPYLLDFLGLSTAYSEKDLESAVLRELEQFLLELGTDFTFVARQKRLSIGKEDFYLDLLFYHRGLRRLVAIELKLGRFSAAHFGQMELYLRWLDKYERRPGEDAPLGLILCSEKDEDQFELLELGRSGIRVAEYLTELPPRPLLEAKLHEAIRRAREQVGESDRPTQVKPKKISVKRKRK